MRLTADRAGGREDLCAGAPAPARDVTWDVLSRHINDIIILSDLKGVIFYASPSCRQLGYSQLDLIGGAAADFVHPDDLDHFIANGDALLGGRTEGVVFDREHRIRAKDGSWVWMEGSPSLLPSGDGGAVGLLNVFRDVTERRRIRDRLVESERRYRLIAENATDMISQTSCADGRLTYLSPSVERVTGYRADELIGARMQDHIHPDDRDRFLAAFIDLMAGRSESGQAIRFRARHKDGSWLWLESNPRLVRGPDGRPSDFIDVTRDVSEQERLKDQLRKALAEAEHAASVKGEFLANMSHEIRTPLTAVLGFASLLAERSDLDAAAQNHVGRIVGGSRALMAVVNDVLDFSKLEAGEITIRRTPASAEAAGREVLEMFALQAEAKGLALEFTAEPGLPMSLILDEDRLRQILTNLVGNAVKFTETGRVGLALSYDGEGRLVAEVSDTGPGLTAEDQIKLFQRFSQVDGSSTRIKGGTGLGLAICRGLAQVMGGSVSVTSGVGQGSTFRLALPAQRGAAAVAGEDLGADTDQLCGLRVLVVDDNAVNRELARAILEPAGVEVTDASDGLEAVVVAARVPFDLILMDLRMPGLDGRGAMAAIRKAPGPNQHMPILAFSADGMMEQGRPDLAGFQGVVRKPISPAELLRALLGAIEDDQSMEEGPSYAAAS